jgi:hypothetical protein
MRRVAVRATGGFLCVFVCLVSGLARPQDGATTPLPHPDDGTIVNGVYVSKYFDLSYPLPPGWTKGLAGPRPSHSGYYVLSTLVPENDQRAVILLAAQDTFFGAPALRDALTMATEIDRTMSKIEGMIIDRPPSDVTIAGRAFTRIDFSGVGLFRSALITLIRCHLVSFNITANSPDLLATLVLSLDKLGNAGGQGGRDADPVCKANQASTEHLLTRVDPRAIAPFTTIPVRIIIDAGGIVKDVHVIRATTDQRSAIEAALGQWRFRPPALDTGVTALETGVLIELTSAGR